MTTKSRITVTVQLICIAVLVLTGPIIPKHAPALVLGLAGLMIIVWAVATMGLYNLRVEPDVHEHARLVTSGLYGLIRHPMYSGGTLIALAWVWDKFTVLRLAAMVILVVDFLVKLKYEESLLSARFPNYPEYMQRTKRLIPFIY